MSAELSFPSRAALPINPSSAAADAYNNGLGVEPKPSADRLADGIGAGTQYPAQNSAWRERPALCRREIDPSQQVHDRVPARDRFALARQAAEDQRRNHLEPPLGLGAADPRVPSQLADQIASHQFRKRIEQRCHPDLLAPRAAASIHEPTWPAAWIRVGARRDLRLRVSLAAPEGSRRARDGSASSLIHLVGVPVTLSVNPARSARQRAEASVATSGGSAGFASGRTRTVARIDVPRPSVELTFSSPPIRNRRSRMLLRPRPAAPI